ncbi:phage antirepressor KilAC domain-containing protein [Paenirhodobacter populi]|nr:phage antirepressor KilAC domain-containing protein [Sinirhodobacter populi]
MNMPVLTADFNGSNITMSSREIAELCETRHNQVVETIERLMASGVLRESRKTTRRVQPEGGGRPMDVYDLTKRDTLVVVSGYKDEVRARIIDRRMELEGQAKSPKALDFTDPQVVLGVITSLQGEVAKRDAKLIEQQPKVEAYDDLMNADGLYGLQNAGRVLGARPNLFIRWLKQDYLFYQGNALVARVQYIQRGYFEVKTKIVDDKARPETFVTPKGLDYLRDKVPVKLLIGGAQ